MFDGERNRPQDAATIARRSCSEPADAQHGRAYALAHWMSISSRCELVSRDLSSAVRRSPIVERMVHISANHSSRFQDFVTAAKECTWRATTRDAAVSAGGRHGVTHLVYDVIDPGSGPTFVSDLSRIQQSDRSRTDAEQSVRLAVQAVTWLPDLVDEIRQARQLLEAALAQLSDETADQVRAFLHHPGVEATFNRPTESEKDEVLLSQIY